MRIASCISTAAKVIHMVTLRLNLNFRFPLPLCCTSCRTTNFNCLSTRWLGQLLLFFVKLLAGLNGMSTFNGTRTCRRLSILFKEWLWRLRRLANCRGTDSGLDHGSDPELVFDKRGFTRFADDKGITKTCSLSKGCRATSGRTLHERLGSFLFSYEKHMWINLFNNWEY